MFPLILLIIVVFQQIEFKGIPVSAILVEDTWLDKILSFKEQLLILNTATAFDGLNLDFKRSMFLHSLLVLCDWHDR